MIRQVLFVAFEVFIPGVAIIGGLVVSMNGRKALGWSGTALLLGAWLAGLVLLAAVAIGNRPVTWWMWMVGLGAPGLGALWLGVLTRRTVRNRQEHP